jgi:hydroxyacylglutathione hydrolase
MIDITAISALTDNYIWVITNSQTQCALVVDPGDAEPVLAYLKQHQLILSGILITHHHWDHVNGVPQLLQSFPVPVYGSKQNSFSEITHRLDEGDLVRVKDFPGYRIFAIPGHTLDHIAYAADGSVFCGDTLFAGGCGRLFEGTAELLYSSLQKIAALPETTRIYCAHEYTLKNLGFAQMVEPSNQNIELRIDKVRLLREKGLPSIPSQLIEELQTNPFLRCDRPEIIQQVSLHVNRSLAQPVDVFAELRKWKNNF